jgi:hypothetical protein
MITNQQGTALIVSLLMLVLITTMGIAATNTSIVEGWLSANYRSSKQAFYVAEAGLEFTRNALRADRDWSDSDNKTAPGGTINVGGREATYTITLRDATKDKIIITSTGVIAGSTSVVEALVERNTIPPIPGAVNLVGDIAVDDIDFDEGERFLIDGRDYRLGEKAGNPRGTDPARLGISVNDVLDGSERVREIKKDIEDEDNDLKGKIKGHGKEEPSVDIGKVINIELTKRYVSEFVSTIKNKNMADIRLADTDTDPLTKDKWDAAMRTVADPKIVYVEITEDIDIKWHIEGAGILIIEGSGPELEVAISGDGEEGSIDWTGLVIITGKDVDVDLYGGGEKEKASINIRGALVVNSVGEEGEDEEGEIEITGNVELLYSEEALDIAQQKIPATVSSWRQVHN